ncbi:MAG TPA: bifunctional 2-polyprenyl-6-hydroxyphenol methylase/3-demethylubiquinol 3-O-methyltransferase UbiG [Burkholderiales bacterium]|nr:bifunctional 2-polyprenyl-6-hydroxyphenol methylase/3-demethylubiquinol 3-O-methyltransferase UbiG [Burkholderiales bacterium]
MNVDPLELEKFSKLAHRWWDPDAEFKPLHDMNPLRLDYVDKLAGLNGKVVLDVGCGGGILAESMAARGAHVTGIDLGEGALKVARLHLLESGNDVDYRNVAVEDLAREQPRYYEIITCMEFLEHVPDPASTVRACSELVKPGGHIFFSTINRNLKSYLVAVIGAEYVLRLLPRGTHDYARFIKPSELARFCRDARLNVEHITGLTYNPFSKIYAIGIDTDANYILHATAD